MNDDRKRSIFDRDPPDNRVPLNEKGVPPPRSYTTDHLADRMGGKKGGNSEGGGKPEKSEG